MTYTTHPIYFSWGKRDKITRTHISENYHCKDNFAPTYSLSTNTWQCKTRAILWSCSTRHGFLMWHIRFFRNERANIVSNWQIACFLRIAPCILDMVRKCRYKKKNWKLNSHKKCFKKISLSSTVTKLACLNFWKGKNLLKNKLFYILCDRK